MDGREGSSTFSPQQPAPPPNPPPPGTLAVSSGGESEEDIVMSEVHLGCPPNSSGPHISRFTFSLPPVEPGSKYIDRIQHEATSTSTHQVVSLDEDGDLVVARRSKRSTYNYVITIQHNITSSIPRVGLQVWRAELLLADFVLHKMITSSEFNEVVAVELGAGTGLVGVLLGRVAKTIFLTDKGDEILDNCANNVSLNSEIFHSQASIHVRELDWKKSWPTTAVENSQSQKRYAWTSEDVEELKTASLIVAADVIYSDDLTDAFFNTLERLMMHKPEKVVFLALEKRYNFTLDDLNVVASGYAHFRSYLREEESSDLNNRSSPCFVGKCIDITQIPQYVREYDRGNDTEIWEIKYEKQNPDHP